MLSYLASDMGAGPQNWKGLTFSQYNSMKKSDTAGSKNDEDAGNIKTLYLTRHFTCEAGNYLKEFDFLIHLKMSKM